MSQALIQLSLDLIAGSIFQGMVTVKAAFSDVGDTARGTVTLLIEGDGLPEVPAAGEKIPRVRCVVSRNIDENTVVPKETLFISFEKES